MKAKIIPTEEGLLIESRTPVDNSFVNKINNPVNKDKINAHLKDMRCTHHIETDNSGSNSVLVFSTYEPMSEEDFARTIKVVKANHDSFIENVERRMVEIESQSTQVQHPNSVREDLEFVEKVLNGIVKGKIILAVLIQKVEDSPCLPCGYIKAETLQEMCELYIEYYANRNS